MANVRDEVWANGHDESVEVNQRALIDKVLARYSGEFTVFRELLQNSDDAGAGRVKIYFETEAFINARGSCDTSLSVHTTNTKLPDLATSVIHRWSFKNDGIAFRDQDWTRLKKIAEGNPDEEKIGAFGVGFYSLFSVTEEPFVTSGGKWMGFYWKDKKDQLFARRGEIPSADGLESDEWTTFSMPLREPGPPPTPFDFIRFLASSITFMAHLSEVSVYFDEKRLARLVKRRGVPEPVGLRKSLKPKTPKGTMQITSIEHTSLTIRAEVMQWVYTAGTASKPRRPSAPSQQQQPKGTASGFFSSLFASFGGSGTPERDTSPMRPISTADQKDNDEREAEEQRNLLSVSETGVLLAIFSADVNVSLDERMKQELLRATKKNPPHRMRYELIYTGKQEYDASKAEDERTLQTTGSIYQGLRADIEGTGSARIFIMGQGHSTGQTTGVGGHMSARFIPTVERESIDLVDRNVRVWNEELLSVGGYLARTAYEREMDNIGTLWVSAGNGLAREEIHANLWSRALHAMKFFTFHTSTPAAQVSTLMEEAFFSCSISGRLGFLTSSTQPPPFQVISTVGVQDASNVRIPNEVFAAFLKQLPVIPESILDGARVMIDTLRTRGLIKEITFQDVLQELRARPLQESEIIACFKWWINVNRSDVDTTRTSRIRTEILNAAVLTIGSPGTPEERIIPMSVINTFLNSRSNGAFIPTDGPLPDHLLPLSVSRHFEPQALISAFGWHELSIIEWLRHILDPNVANRDVEHDLTNSAPWAERVLSTLSRVWPSCGKNVQEDVARLLIDKPCVPTSCGLRIPSEAYFQSAHVFPDLPLVTMPSGVQIKGPLEKVLSLLGVRKHVDLQIVFDRMIKTGDWSIAELTKYLVAVQSTLSSEEMQKLQLTAVFPKEGQLNEITQAQTKIARYKASDLYEPLDIFRQLDLPIIDWGKHTKWKTNSEEAKFLFRLGLRKYPPLRIILVLAASPNASTQAAALKYFLDHRATNYSDYNISSYSELAFVPALRGNVACLGKPGEVFTNPTWASLGFLTAHPSLQADSLIKLGVKEHPPTSSLVDLLQNTPPHNIEMARLWFSAMAIRIAEFSPGELRDLSKLPIVPVQVSPVAGGHVRIVPPGQCYFKRDTEASMHHRLFTFIDFGVQANQFLSACGTKPEPSVQEIAQILLDNPQRFRREVEGDDNFLAELRNIAVNRRVLSSATITSMKRSSVLLGSRRVKRNKPSGKGNLEDPEEEDWEYEYELLTPDQVVIADDTNTYQLFGDAVFSCPQEDILEAFYMELGSCRLSSLVKEEYKTSSEIKENRKGGDTRSLILERLPLFLHEHTHAKTRVPYTWLDNEANFIVRTFGKLSVVKSLAHDRVRAIKSQEASAVAMRHGRGPIELWLAGNDNVDMFEVSTSICRLLFDSPRASDALLFMTILSTDLRALRRRGYNVDRILQRQKAQRQAAEKAQARVKQTALISSGPDVQPSIERLPETHIYPHLAVSETAIAENQSSDTYKDGRTQSTLRNSWGNFRKKLAGKDDAPQMPGSLPAPIPKVPSSQEPLPSIPGSLKTGIQETHSGTLAATTGRGPLLTPPRPSSSRPISPGLGVTPQSNIATNIDMAIRACREEKGKLLENKERMQIIKESLNDSYCDVSGQAGDLTLAGQMGDMKFYVSKDISHPHNTLQNKRESLARFIHTIHPLREIYGLPSSSLHFFFDLTGGIIAFNRNGSLFLNLRFFEVWHDDEVRGGQTNKAYTSWYFTLAHEIAHNLVGPHNAEHEFYFSAICEAHMERFARLLTVV